MPLRFLVVDDDEAILTTLRIALERGDHEVVTCSSAAAALECVSQGMFDLALVDMRLESSDGLDLLQDLRQRAPWLEVVVITAHASVQTAVDAMKRGASDYLVKPVSPTQLMAIAERYARVRELEERVETLSKDVARLVPQAHLESKNPGMRRMLELARRVADSPATVLITGESGTGKGVLARAIHDWSSRKERPFSTVSCPSLSPALLQSELFGHVRGAFTGAVAKKRGRIEITEKGTLFLDEIGDLPMEIQPLLLRFLQTREYERVGDPTTRTADVRIIAATNQDLERAVEEGDFREDLYYRLNVVHLEVPPLQARPEDVVSLAEQFLLFFQARYGRRRLVLTDRAASLIKSYSWPGNVRELQNAVERAVILAEGEDITHELFPLRNGGALPTTEPGSLSSLEEMESQHIRLVLASTDSIAEAAETLGISTATLWRRRQKYGI